MNIIPKKVSANIYWARLSKNDTQEGLARKMGKTQQWIHKIEKGIIEPDFKQLNQLSELLSIDTKDLLFNDLKIRKDNGL